MITWEHRPVPVKLLRRAMATFGKEMQDDKLDVIFGAVQEHFVFNRKAWQHELKSVWRSADGLEIELP